MPYPAAYSQYPWVSAENGQYRQPALDAMETPAENRLATFYAKEGARIGAYENWLVENGMDPIDARAYVYRLTYIPMEPVSRNEEIEEHFLKEHTLKKSMQPRINEFLEQKRHQEREAPQLKELIYTKLFQKEGISGERASEHYNNLTNPHQGWMLANRFNKSVSSGIYDKLNLSGRFDKKQFLEGFRVELEHGSHDKETDVTHNDPTKTAKIVMAHLKEDPEYYTKLKKAKL